MGNYDEWAAGKDSIFREKLSSIRNKEPVPAATSKLVKKSQQSAPVDYLERLAAAPTSSRGSSADEERRVLYDDLTDLNNFKTFMKALVYEMKRGERYKRPLAVATISIDGLEGFRNECGQEAANHVLRTAASIIKSSVRDVDIPARHNENGFVVLFPETNASGITTVCERIRQRINAQPITYATQSYNITTSIGAAAFPAHARKPEDLLARASQAQLVAEQRGGNKVSIA